ncbi:MAG TPA: hypothetical protein PKI94_03220 [Candidatus Gastranaerophilaceae bacterium]|nr:hypothetical protein [Candidatus Gastranaerophilaceae bacterium]
MKKILLIILSVIIFSPKVFAESENIALLTQKGFFDKIKTTSQNPYEEIRDTFYLHTKFSNEYKFEQLKDLYAPNYYNADGFNRENYFDLIKKTWENYPGIKYKMEIIDIKISGNYATVYLEESARADTASAGGILRDKGYLQSNSDTIYFLEKIANEWKITSDNIIFEKTYLTYGSASYCSFNLNAPSKIPMNTEYTATLNIKSPPDTIVLASIGREKVTYPQIQAEEVFRRLPESGILERMFISNNENLNEFAVASFGVAKLDLSRGSDIKINITGMGFAMSRVNVISAKLENNKNDKKKDSENDKK